MMSPTTIHEHSPYTAADLPLQGLSDAEPAPRRHPSHLSNATPPGARPRSWHPREGR